MLELGPDNLIDYLRDTGRLTAAVAALERRGAQRRSLECRDARHCTR